MSPQTAGLKGLLHCLSAIVAIAGWVGSVDAQALVVDQLSGGTRLVVVNQPLADATTIVWPPAPGESSPGQLVVGRLTLSAEVEAVLGTGGDSLPVPPVVVAVGGATADELSALLEGAFGDRAPYAVSGPAPTILEEGGLDRRLGAPGSDALLRLEVLLPAPGDSRRSSVEVLWDLIPQLVSDTGPLYQSRVEGQIGVLEGRVDAEVAELELSQLRLKLARLASDPALQLDGVVDARRRLGVRRQASLEEHPEAAHLVLERWLEGGESAVRQHLFGVQGVTLDSVRDAAFEWLPSHPGRALLILPPRVYNPRFAVGPETHRLANDLTVAILERSGASLAVICLRPVLVPDLDGEVTATVLARLARELRLADSRPGFIRVRTSPPLIEIAGPADGFGELMEQLTTAYGAVLADASTIVSVDGDARRRALDLMAGVLGLTEDGDPSPAALLRPGNLALGVVAPDAEAAAEAVGKFWSMEAPATATADVHDVPTANRTRVAASGDESVVVIALDLAFGGLEAVNAVARELIGARARDRWPDARVEVLEPYVPGRALLLLVVAAEGTVDEVEARVASGWARLTGAVGEKELAPVKRRAAAMASAEMSGVSGHARRCAATAAGAARWHQPAELELEILTVDPEVVGTMLGRFADFESLQLTGAGVLPVNQRGRR